MENRSLVGLKSRTNKEGKQYPLNFYGTYIGDDNKLIRVYGSKKDKKETKNVKKLTEIPQGWVGYNTTIGLGYCFGKSWTPEELKKREKLREERISHRKQIRANRKIRRKLNSSKTKALIKKYKKMIRKLEKSKNPKVIQRIVNLHERKQKIAKLITERESNIYRIPPEMIDLKIRTINERLSKISGNKAVAKKEVAPVKA